MRRREGNEADGEAERWIDGDKARRHAWAAMRPGARRMATRSGAAAPLPGHPGGPAEARAAALRRRPRRHGAARSRRQAARTRFVVDAASGYSRHRRRPRSSSPRRREGAGRACRRTLVERGRSAVDATRMLAHLGLARRAGQRRRLREGARGAARPASAALLLAACDGAADGARRSWPRSAGAGLPVIAALSTARELGWRWAVRMWCMSRCRQGGLGARLIWMRNGMQASRVIRRERNANRE